MSIFTSVREKRLWLYALIVWLAILSTLVMGLPIQELLVDQNTQFILFLSGMILMAAAVITHGLKVRPGKKEVAIWIGLAAVGIMLFFRLGASERSHLIEYGALAICVHRALIERLRHKNQLLIPGLVAFSITFFIGILDEFIQLLLPSRVFDTNDILFNGLAALLAIGGALLLSKLKKYRLDASHG